MNLKVGDKVKVKSLEEIAKIAKEYDKEDEIYIFDGYYDFVEEMFKYCGKQVEIKEIKEKEFEHEPCSCYIKEDNGVCNWIEDWFVKEEPSYYITDFDGTVEEITPAEAYWGQVMPQIKEIVINAYNKGIEIGKLNI